MHTRYATFGGKAVHKRLLLILLIALSGLPLARAEQVQLMFVQTADDLKADGKTLRLVNVGQQTLYFSDRPVRIAGHMHDACLLDEWKARRRPGQFRAAIRPTPRCRSMSRGSNENTLAVVEISHPVVDGKDLVYNYKLIDGTMPKAGGATALFIDWIGVGGGVGVGFHGVGVGCPRASASVRSHPSRETREASGCSRLRGADAPSLRLCRSYVD